MSVSVAVKDASGQGAHWEASSRSLLHADVVAGDVHRWNSITGEVERKHFDEAVSLVVPAAASGGYVISMGRKLVQMDWNSGNVIKEFCDVDQGLLDNRFNEGKCDAAGRLWAGTMAKRRTPGVTDEGKGSLFSLDRDGTVRKHLTGITVSNGLAWSADNTIMYHVDYPHRKIFAFDFDISSGTLDNKRVAVTMAPDTELASFSGFPDGMTVDTGDNIWLACYQGGKVICFDPYTGKDVRTIDLPAKRITSCCFGGPNYDELYVTSSLRQLSPEQLAVQPLAGSVFKVTGLGVRGTASAQFAG